MSHPQHCGGRAGAGAEGTAERLRALDLSCNPLAGHDDESAPGRVGPQYTRWVSVRFATHPLAMLLDAAPQLTRLDLGHTMLTQHACARLCGALGGLQRLEALSLRGTRMSGSMWDAAVCAAAALPRLRALDVAGTRNASGKQALAAAAALRAWLRRRAAERSRCDRDGDSVMSEDAHAWHDTDFDEGDLCSQGQHLDISSCHLDTAFVEALTAPTAPSDHASLPQVPPNSDVGAGGGDSSRPTWPQLASLNLSHNAVYTCSICQLAGALARAPALTRLDLNDVCAGDKGCRAVLSALLRSASNERGSGGVHCARDDRREGGAKIVKVSLRDTGAHGPGWTAVQALLQREQQGADEFVLNFNDEAVVGAVDAALRRC